MTMRPDMYQFHNGEKACLPFSDTEYEARLSLLRATMRQVGCTAAVLTSMHNIAYYAGFLALRLWSPLCAGCDGRINRSRFRRASMPASPGAAAMGTISPTATGSGTTFWRAIHHVTGTLDR